MLHVIIPATGRAYQKAAARAASTYACVMRSAARVTVLIPRAETVASELASAAAAFGFRIETFEFRAETSPSSPPLVTQFKCRAFLEALARIEGEDLLLAVDADTFCNRFIDLDAEVRDKILRGGVGLAPDLADHHTADVSRAWFVAPDRRQPYVNAGVVVAAKGAGDFFKRVLELSWTEGFRAAPYYDQTAINYLLNVEFPGRLVLLDKRYNGMRPRFDEQTIIGHWAGGAGGLEDPGSNRDAGHEHHCALVIEAHCTNS